MKRIRKHIHLLMLSLLTLTMSCEDLAFGDKFLQKPPSGDVTIDTIFSTAEYARRVLWYSYSTLPYGYVTGWNISTGMWVSNIEGLTDLNQSSVGYGGVEDLYYNGLYNAGTEDKGGADGATKYRFIERSSWKGIRHAWLFIENVERVPDMSPEEKNRLIAEAKIIIAIQYAEMLRHYGALPIVDHSIKPEDVNLPKRATLQQTVKFITDLLNEAIDTKELPWSLPASEHNNWDGRLTRAAAMGLKVRVLLFVASPLFNADKPYFEGEASTQLMTWFGDYNKKRWEDAVRAGADFFEAVKKEGYYDLVKTGAYRMVFRDAYYTRGTTESLISCRRHFKTTDNAFFMQASRWGASCPTKEYFDMFPMADGSDFDWDNPEHRKNPFINRDPRLCETILLDGDKFGDHNAEVFQAKKGDKNYPKGKDWNLKNYLDSKSLATGIALRKFVLDRQGEYKGRITHWPYLRLAEIYLSYAEALNECDRTDEAYPYINAVRNRVGLDDLKGGLDKKAFREAILRERACEFGWEEVRFFDLIRWKRAEDFTKHLHGINIYRHKTTKEYQFEFPQLKERAWQKEGGFSAKWYLSAFPAKEVSKGYGLVQNPGWE
ncbi:RagB/SusD family nutrient uptake outer membrane protein [Bacteroides ovatus]|uniref:RagB/SusD family nutrient uptake outer membrane protein n=1 Tax=Bacteroides ovatus TaxID=28116 RepID=UPI001896D5BB|nr:RagB/SusD family nutrient uptake outer membrane protein [Bacteroides ovatus]MDC2621923.1 RagB/SusD family nutrient uptake outer membrane protein [Bacteroides ovatus]MDC2635867.1 RagB/SusD family nutrient uptake outer membrane protein [Bacteroides ovatus]MDC2649814.1 RagB/SusD family nutrient uptake outer membrane protein [Bacteroides ovatus]